MPLLSLAWTTVARGSTIAAATSVASPAATSVCCSPGLDGAISGEYGIYGKTDAMSGSLTPADTPGGGLAMVLILEGALDEHARARAGRWGYWW